MPCLVPSFRALLIVSCFSCACDALRELSEESKGRAGNLRADRRLDEAFRKLRIEFARKYPNWTPEDAREKSVTLAPPTASRSSRRQTLLQLSNVEQPSSRPLNGTESVLFSVWTDSKFYDTRLKGILQTWGKEIPAQHFMAVSDKRRISPPGKNEPGSQVEETSCPPHSHWEGACCKWAEGVILAQKRMQQNPALKWAFFSDDDVYLRPSSIASTLSSHETDKPVALGIFGCNTAGGCWGLCGGGGFAVNRAAVARLAGADPVTFLNEEMSFCQKCERWADQAISMIWKERGIEMKNLQGLNGWIMKEDVFKEQLKNGNPNLLFHYQPSANQMAMLHELFTGEKVLSEETGPCADFDGHHACAASSNPADIPFIVAPGDQQ